MSGDGVGGTGAVPSVFGSYLNESAENSRNTDDTAVAPPAGRKHPVHQPLQERPNEPIIVFLTVCTKDRKQILDDRVIHQHLIDAWLEAKSWLVGRYVIMPDHVHLFCAPTDLHSKPLLQWVSFWKARSARHWPPPNDRPVWQRHFWDTQLRRHQSYDEKWDYVVQNPLRAGLAECVDDWPYQGELNLLRW
jgi:putative transposase